MSLNPHFQKSSYSGSSDNCVEAARNEPGLVAVRDSKDRKGPKLVLTLDRWQAFVRTVKAGGAGLA
jgi:hypothetical protein